MKLMALLKACSEQKIDNLSIKAFTILLTGLGFLSIHDYPKNTLSSISATSFININHHFYCYLICFLRRRFPMIFYRSFFSLSQISIDSRKAVN
jgi:hypothetical protein